ncbi:MAG: hypothetical protein EZS26_003185 [Candidatus Ordinivivax streblomastigis]|uniref:Uncharacterized protein n=1 Tax=Candidatus Ordinivivax streblomastigis TaxID=2540710 RepID=A0A5M8NYF4_9BACT|nr:MAG: hypothetical protein EZS26_003185 [Candidatus Ordinivivax streblomastigis]
MFINDAGQAWRYEYRTSADLYDFGTTVKPFGKDFNPRHGTVMSLTQEEWNASKENGVYHQLLIL